MTSKFADTAGSVYAKLVEDELSDEWQRKKSIEDRGFAVVTAAGGIMTFSFALATFAIANSTTAVPAIGKGLLVVAFVCFVISAWQGIQANSPRTYVGVRDADLRRVLKSPYWEADVSIATMRRTEGRIAVLSAARSANAEKADALANAMRFELAGIGVLGVVLVLLIASSR